MIDASSREKREEAEMSLSNGDTDFEAGNLDSALRYYESARQSFREVGNRVREAVALLRMTYVYEQRMQIEKALFLAREARDILAESGEKVLENDAIQRLNSLEHK